MPDKHALLGPSSSGRWTRCPASARIEELIVNDSNEFSEEGTLAHALAEALFNGKEVSFPSEEMEKNVKTYVNYVETRYKELEKDCSFTDSFHEVELDYSKYVPEGFGTADTILIADSKLIIIDFKNGFNLVDANQNTQMMLYAIGALLRYDFIYDIKEVECVICQPRANNIGSMYISAEELIAWGESLKGSVEKAFSGTGETFPGEHCQYCRARGLCRARVNYMNDLLAKGSLPKLMSIEDLEELYPKLGMIEESCKAIKSYMLAEAIKGHKWKGLKLVESKSNRKYSDDLAVADALIKEGIPEALIYNRKLIGLTDMEKLCKNMLGNAKFLTDKGLIVKPVGAPALVLESDKRESYDAYKNALEGFVDIKEEKK